MFFYDIIKKENKKEKEKKMENNKVVLVLHACMMTICVGLIMTCFYRYQQGDLSGVFTLMITLMLFGLIGLFSRDLIQMKKGKF